MYTVQCIHVCVQRYHYSYVDTIAIDHFLYISCTSVPPQNPDIHQTKHTECLNTIVLLCDKLYTWFIE